MKENKIEQISPTIEIATLADSEEMANLKYETVMDEMKSRGNKLLPEDLPDAGADEFRPTLESPSDDEYFLVAKHNGKVVGMCGMFWRPQHERFHFRRFYVRPELQGKNVGSKLFQEAKVRAQGSPHDVRGMYLVTDKDDNEKVQEMYRRWGFRETKREDDWIRMDLDF